MSLELYVGNYPSKFTSEDVEYLFRDFDGIKLERMCKKDLKCFSFMVCKDIDQLVSVIQNMNDAIVSGRHLKVRASNRSLQDYVNLLLQETKNDCNNESQNSSFVESNDDGNYDSPNSSFVESNCDVNSDAQNIPFVPLQVIKNKFSIQKYEKDMSKKNENSPTRSCSDGDRHFYTTDEQNYEKVTRKFGNSMTLSCDKSDEHYSYATGRQNSEKDVAREVEHSSTSLATLKEEHSSTPSQNIGDEHNSYATTRWQNYERDSVKNFENSTTRSCNNGDKHYYYTTGRQNSKKDVARKFEHTSTPSHNIEDEHNSYATGCQNYEGGSAKKFDISPTQSSCGNGDEHYSYARNKQNYKKDSAKIFESSSIRPFSNGYEHYSHTTGLQSYEKDVAGKFENSTTRSSCSNDDNCYFDNTSYNSQSAIVSQGSKCAKNSFSQQHENNELTWVSVTNFPIGTSIKSIYELFSDFNPIKVKIMCNAPRRNRILTEAHVGFRNRDVANDVILTFDNTLFNGRIILVTDIEDLTIMNELIKVFHS